VPTTDPAITERFLNALSDAGIGFAVLHGEGAIDSVTGDLDIVADQPPLEILREVAPVISPIVPILTCAYEPGGSRSIFLSTPDLEEGAQLDILFDRQGRGSLGFRSQELLRSTVAGSRYPTLGRDAQLAYLVRKRAVKAQSDQLPDLITEAATSPTFRSQLNRIATPRAFESIKGALDGCYPERSSKAPFSTRHLADRLTHPVGAWIDCGNEGETAREIARRAGRILPHAASAALPSRPSARLIWWARMIEPIRLRPGVVTTWGGRSTGFPRSDYSLKTAEGIAGAVSWLAHRVAFTYHR
jgi:hypothetical protein